MSNSTDISRHKLRRALKAGLAWKRRAFGLEQAVMFHLRGQKAANHNAAFHQAENAKLRKEQVEALGYAIDLLSVICPEAEAFDELMPVLTQIDSEMDALDKALTELMAYQRDVVAKLRKVANAAKGAHGEYLEDEDLPRNMPFDHAEEQDG